MLRSYIRVHEGFESGVRGAAPKNSPAEQTDRDAQRSGDGMHRSAIALTDF